MKIYYRLLSIDRIGQLFEELFSIKNLYPEEEVVIITSNPDYHPRLNRQAFECIINNFSHKFINNHAFLCDRHENPYTDNLIKFGDGYLFHKEPCGLRREFYKKYSSKKSPFYFKLRGKDMDLGDEIMEVLGVPKNKKIVTLHVRENGYVPELKYHSFRDCNINNCVKAIDYLIKKGYYVIRLGDPTMKKLILNSSNYIELSHSEFTHTIAELYLISKAEFHIGTGSGVWHIAQTCGTPILSLNTELPFCVWGNEYDIELPRVFYSKIFNRNLSVYELANSDILTYSETNQYKSSGLKLIENNEDVVLESTKEMINNIKENNTGSNIDHSYFPTIKTLYYEMGKRNPRFSYPYAQKKKIAESYLKNNPEFLGVPF